MGLKGFETLHLDMRDEIVLTTQGKGFKKVILEKRNKIRLPDKVLDKLGINERVFVALVERKKALDIKKFQVVERKSDMARIVDLETAYEMVRVAGTNPMPDELPPKLRERFKDFGLKYDLGSFLNGRGLFEAWKARQILGVPELSDEELRKEPTKERLKNKREDGSW